MRKYVFLLTVLFAGALAAQTQAQDGWHKFGESRPADPPPLPADVRLPAGSWITVRVDQPLSSDHNHPGDAFTATLVQPLENAQFQDGRSGRLALILAGEVRVSEEQIQLLVSQLEPTSVR